MQALIEVSGKTSPLQVALVGDRVELKLSERIDIRKSTVPGSTAVVDMEGITHLLCEMPVPEDEKTSAADLLSANKLLNLPAAGVIFFSQTGQEFHITPVVWVKATRSLVCESACASGTMALAVWMNRCNPYPGQAINVTQPGAAVISVRAKEGAYGMVEITMQSRVSVLDETDIKIVLEP
jgi:diaminopimelate epimerase